MDGDVIMMNSKIWRNKQPVVTQVSAKAAQRPVRSSLSNTGASKKRTGGKAAAGTGSTRTRKQLKRSASTTPRTGKRIKRSAGSTLRTRKRQKCPNGSRKPAASYIYRDPLYSFTLKLPRSWKSFTAVARSNKLDDAEYGVFFRFKYKGKVYDDVLSLLVYKMTLKQWHDDGYDDSPIQFLGTRNGRIYAYTVPGELPEEFLNESGDDYDYKKYGRQISLMKRMVNDEVPQIVKTFMLKRLTVR